MRLSTDQTKKKKKKEKKKRKKCFLIKWLCNKNKKEKRVGLTFNKEQFFYYCCFFLFFVVQK